MADGKLPIAERCRMKVETRRAHGASATDIATFAMHCVRSFRLSVATLHLTFPEAVVFDRLQRDIEARQAERRQQAAPAANPTFPPRLPTLPRSSLISTGVIERLGCTAAELSRWSADGRLPPDGERSTLLGGRFVKRLRAWLPETVEVAANQLPSWRIQDAVRKSRARRGLRVVA